MIFSLAKSWSRPFGGCLRWSNRLLSRGGGYSGGNFASIYLTFARLRQGAHAQQPHNLKAIRRHGRRLVFFCVFVILFGCFLALGLKQNSKMQLRDNLESFAIIRPGPSIAAATAPAVETRFLKPTGQHVVSFRGFCTVSGYSLT